VTRSNWKEAFLGTTGTSGVIFSNEEGILNIALGKVHQTIVGDESGDPAEIAFRIEPTEYKDGPRLVPTRGMQLHLDPATWDDYPTWLEVSVKEVQPTSAGAASDVAVTPPQAVKSESPKGPAGDPETESRYQRLREYLETLKRLRTDGVLSEEEYQREREKALSSLREAE
jgi:hypothetical protein